MFNVFLPLNTERPEACVLFQPAQYVLLPQLFQLVLTGNFLMKPVVQFRYPVVCHILLSL